MTLKDRFAAIIAFISSPPIVLTVFLTYIVFHFSYSMKNAVLWLILAVILIGILPVLYAYIAAKLGHIKDIYLNRRQDRTGPFLVACLGMIITMMIFYAMDVPKEILLFFMSGILITLIIMIINLFWKISVHATTITMVLMVVNVLSHYSYWYLFIFVPFVMWARVVQERHTVKQVVAGTFLGAVVVFGIYSLFGF